MKFKNVAINVSNLSKGGGAQIAIWLINKLVKDESLPINLTYLVSPFVWEGIKGNFTDASSVYIIPASPVRSRKAKSMVISVIDKAKIELVYTLYGPSGVSFDCKEISGVANAWISCAKLKDFWQVYGLTSPIEILKFFIHGWNLKQKDFLTFETELSQRNFCNRFHFNKCKTKVIPNSVNDYFYQDRQVIKRKSKIFNILYVSSYYKHKNFELIPKYVLALKHSNEIQSIKFQLTLSDSEFEPIKELCHQLGVLDSVDNLGVLSSEQLPEVYQCADLVISPSILETFSATYAEAILSGKYLIVADRPFSRAICKDAALYFEPSNSNAFKELVEKVYLKRNTTSLDRALLKKNELFISSEQRYKLIKDLLLNISANLQIKG